MKNKIFTYSTISYGNTDKGMEWINTMWCGHQNHLNDSPSKPYDPQIESFARNGAIPDHSALKTCGLWYSKCRKSHFQHDPTIEIQSIPLHFRECLHAFYILIYSLKRKITDIF
eukprot:300778_1